MSFGYYRTQRGRGGNPSPTPSPSPIDGTDPNPVWSEPTPIPTPRPRYNRLPPMSGGGSGHSSERSYPIDNFPQLVPVSLPGDRGVGQIPGGQIPLYGPGAGGGTPIDVGVNVNPPAYVPPSGPDVGINVNPPDYAPPNGGGGWSPYYPMPAPSYNYYDAGNGTTYVYDQNWTYITTTGSGQPSQPAQPSGGGNPSSPSFAGSAPTPSMPWYAGAGPLPGGNQNPGNPGYVAPGVGPQPTPEDSAGPNAAAMWGLWPSPVTAKNI